MSRKITIIGAGLAGSLLSIYLAKRGYEVEVFERRPDMRTHDIGGGRSINLALSTRGIHALKEVGLWEEIQQIAIPMYGRMVHPLGGKVNLQQYGKSKDEYINSVSRAELNKRLMTLAENNYGDRVKFRFNMRCISAELSKGEVLFINEDSGQGVKIDCERIIATDGATSPIRQEMLKLPRFNFEQEYENYGYKELTIPADENGKHRLEKNALHIWPRGQYMLIALPNTDGTFTCTLFMAYDKIFGGKASFEYLDSEEKAREFLRKTFPDAYELMPGCVNEFMGNPVGSLITIKCYPWCVEDKSALLGDAAHAIVPFFGQGMNAAFEDCTYLNELIGKHEDDWSRIFSEYQQIRKPNADAIADLAQENFVEMRDLVADEKFILKKKLGLILEEKFPEKFIPKYSMVTFHRVPYSTALERGRIQEDILNELTERIKTPEDADLDKAGRLISERLKNFNELK